MVKLPDSYRATEAPNPAACPTAQPTAEVA